MDAIKPLPQVSTFSASVFSFLDDRFRDAADLSQSPGLVSQLKTEISELDQRLAGLNRRLESGLASYASFSDRIGGLLIGVNAKLADLSSSSTSASGSYCQIRSLVMIVLPNFESFVCSYPFRWREGGGDDGASITGEGGSTG